MALRVERPYFCLLTTTAVTFFRQLGFSNVKREDAPETIAKSERVLCPLSHVCDAHDVDAELGVDLRM